MKHSGWNRTHITLQICDRERLQFSNRKQMFLLLFKNEAFTFLNSNVSFTIQMLALEPLTPDGLKTLETITYLAIRAIIRQIIHKRYILPLIQVIDQVANVAFLGVGVRYHVQPLCHGVRHE